MDREGGPSRGPSDENVGADNAAVLEAPAPRDDEPAGEQDADPDEVAASVVDLTGPDDMQAAGTEDVQDEGHGTVDPRDIVGERMGRESGRASTSRHQVTRSSGRRKDKGKGRAVEPDDQDYEEAARVGSKGKTKNRSRQPVDDDDDDDEILDEHPIFGKVTHFVFKADIIHRTLPDQVFSVKQLPLQAQPSANRASDVCFCTMHLYSYHTHHLFQKPVKTVSLAQFGWHARRMDDDGRPKLTKTVETIKVQIFPGMEAEGDWLKSVQLRAHSSLVPLQTHGSPTVDIGYVNVRDRGKIVVITRPDWNTLSTDMKLELFESFNILIPSDPSNTVWGDVQDWSSLDALEQHVPLHTQHCVHGESNNCHFIQKLIMCT